MKHKDLTLEDIKECLAKGIPEAQLLGIEYKSSWQKSHGSDLSAISNSINLLNGWVIVGAADSGKLTGRDANWAKGQEQTISSQINQCLDPYFAVKQIVAFNVGSDFAVAIEVHNPGDVVRWEGEAYKLVGTTSPPMTPAEILELSLRLPGADFSKAKSNTHVDPSLVLAFAQKFNEASPEDSQMDLEKSSPAEVLRHLNVYESNVSAILFGPYSFRFAHFDANGDILDQNENKGLYKMLSDSFVEEIQSWTRRQGTEVRGATTAATEEMPYPPKALREVLANAVAHALYQRDGGDIVVELHPDRITVRNNCNSDAKAFVNKWLSRHHKTTHKHLMNTLRAAKITDEQGSGKVRVFRHMLEYGKREPIMGFEDLGGYGRWSITLYNDEANAPLKGLFDRLMTAYNNHQEKVRVAQAILLWRSKTWPEILAYLDENYKYMVEQVVADSDSPVLRINDKIFTRRWAQVALDGQVTKEFSESEKSIYFHVCLNWSSQLNRGGHITSEEAKRLIGLSNTKQESGQVGKLFAEWKAKKFVRKIKNGQWQFVL